MLGTMARARAQRYKIAPNKIELHCGSKITKEISEKVLSAIEYKHQRAETATIDDVQHIVESVLVRAAMQAA